MTTRHEFLAQLHELLKPKVYLEIGVQHGWSLQLSKAELSIGVDPNPLVGADAALNNSGSSSYLARVTSDDFFAQLPANWGKIDLAFIDGMHLAEFAWRDFVNVAQYCHAGSVVVFDDVLPTTQEMAAREQCPGDWTGDVWKVINEVRYETPFSYYLVDTTPTGTLVVVDFFKEADLRSDLAYHSLADIQVLPVPDEIINRQAAWPAPVVLDNLRDRGFGK